MGTRKIYVLHIIESLTSYGGTPNKLLMCCKAFNKERYDLTVAYFLGDDHLKKRLEKSGIKVIKLKHKNILMVPELINIIRVNNIDIINTHFNRSHIFGSLAGMVCKKKLIQFEHGIPRGFYKDTLFHKIMKLIDDCLIKFRKAIICNSYTVKDRVLKTSSVDESKLFVVQNAIDIELFQKKLRGCNRHTYRGYQKRQGEVVIGSIGGFVDLRNFQILIKAFKVINKKYPNTMLFLAGDGKNKDVCVHLAEELEVNNKVIFFNYIDDVPCFLKYIDIYVDVVLVAAGVGLSLLEAMLAENPVIGFMDGDGRDIILNQNNIGIYIDQNNILELIESIEKLILSEEKRESFGENASKLIKNYYYPRRYVNDVYEIYKYVLDD